MWKGVSLGTFLVLLTLPLFLKIELQKIKTNKINEYVWGNIIYRSCPIKSECIYWPFIMTLPVFLPCKCCHEPLYIPVSLQGKTRQIMSKLEESEMLRQYWNWGYLITRTSTSSYLMLILKCAGSICSGKPSKKIVMNWETVTICIDSYCLWMIKNTLGASTHPEYQDKLWVNWESQQVGDRESFCNRGSRLTLPATCYCLSMFWKLSGIIRNPPPLITEKKESRVTMHVRTRQPKI